MTTAYARNAIKLANSASSVDNYYNGYTVEFTRLYKKTGKKTVQKSIITAYIGSSRIAQIGGLWMQDVIPGPQTAEKKDTYRIIPTYADGRVSTNPAIQALDYITSDRYGRGLNPVDDLYLPSWLETARYCDAQSDVTVEVTSGTASVGAIYRYPATGDIQFQGTVHSKDGNFVRFTNVIGKLTNAWNSWKSYKIGQLVYHSNRLYTVATAGVATTEPTHTTGTVGNLTYRSAAVPLTKVSGSGSSTLSLPTNGNPIRVKKGGVYFSGYSLYDADGVDYWRYLGWDEHDQRYATMHQTNLLIDTSQPLFDNMNSLLEHFGGMMRYNAGKYHLEIEAGEGHSITEANDPRYITGDDIIGKIRINDEGIRSAYNSLTVAFADPANKFEARNISFFNSDHLKADRNVPKKGNLSIPGVTNYYNARLLAEKFLTKSRFGLTVSMNLSPRAALLVAGRVFQLPYERYGWDNKKFRITDITHNPDCTVDVVAKEYDDSFYKINAVSQPPGTGKGGSGANTAVPPPTNLKATNVTEGNENRGGLIELSWTNAPNLNLANISTEIYSSRSPNFHILPVSIDKATATIFTSDEPHGLSVGDSVVSDSNRDGFVKHSTYYIQSVPSATQFTLSTAKGATVAQSFPEATQGGGPNSQTETEAEISKVKLQTATLIGVVPYPESKFYDAYALSEGDRVQKYYWIRYRVN